MPYLIREVLAVAVLVGSVSADAPYAGTWKFNPAKSQFAGDTLTINKLPDGMLQFRKVSERSFEMTAKLGGKPYYQDVFTVSADGKTLTDEGTPLNAKTETVNAVYEGQ
jgi:hypothetical protein